MLLRLPVSAQLVSSLVRVMLARALAAELHSAAATPARSSSATTCPVRGPWLPQPAAAAGPRGLMWRHRNAQTAGGGPQTQPRRPAQEGGREDACAALYLVGAKAGVGMSVRGTTAAAALLRDAPGSGLCSGCDRCQPAVPAGLAVRLWPDARAAMQQIPNSCNKQVGSETTPQTTPVARFLACWKAWSCLGGIHSSCFVHTDSTAAQKGGKQTGQPVILAQQGPTEARKGAVQPHAWHRARVLARSFKPGGNRCPPIPLSPSFMPAGHCWAVAC